MRSYYDEKDAEERRNCNTAICHSKAQFKTHLDYFKEHNLLTLKMEEAENPTKSRRDFKYIYYGNSCCYNKNLQRKIRKRLN